MIEFQTEGVAMPELDAGKVFRWLESVAAEYGCHVGNIVYCLCSDEVILEANRKYLGHDYYTDIITFDYTEGDRLSGDIYLSLDTVRSNAEKFGVSYEDEFHRVLAHGVLHLCGLHDKTPEERAEMEEAENRALELCTLNQN